MKFPCIICEKPVANKLQAINCDKRGLWIHIKCNKINTQTYIYLMRENFHWPCMLCTKMFLPHSVLNDNEFKQTVIGKQVKFTHIAKPAISNTGKFIKTINSENNITKCFTIKDLNSTFNDIGNPFSLFHLNINSFSFHFDELENLKSKSKNDFQIIGISEARLKITQETTTNIQLENFNIEHVPTGSAKGRVLLYIKKAINYKLRPDLTIYKKRELDSVFIEIFQEDSKNIVVGCIYRYISFLVAVGLV